MSYSTDPGQKSSAEIEREVETTRARLTGTIEELKERASPGQLFEQVIDYARGSGGQEFMRNLGGAVRDNPLPLLLIGAGIGWMMLSGGGSRDGARVAALPPAPRRSTDDVYLYDAPSSGPSITERAGSALSSVRDSVAGVAAQAGEALSSVRDSVAGAMGSAGEAVSGTWQGAGDTTRHYASYVRDSASGMTSGMGDGLGDMLRRQPLLAGGIGLLVGAAIGAMLPNSGTEDELLGETRKQVVNRVTTLAEQGYQQAKDVAGEALGRVREKLDESGLSPERGAETLGQVARDLREAVERTAHDVAGQARDAAGGGRPAG